MMTSADAHAERAAVPLRQRPDTAARMRTDSANRLAATARTDSLPLLGLSPRTPFPSLPLIHPTIALHSVMLPRAFALRWQICARSSSSFPSVKNRTGGEATSAAARCFASTTAPAPLDWKWLSANKQVTHTLLSQAALKPSTPSVCTPNIPHPTTALLPPELSDPLLSPRPPRSTL